METEKSALCVLHNRALIDDALRATAFSLVSFSCSALCDTCTGPLIITFINMDLLFQYPVALSIEVVSARLRCIAERHIVGNEGVLFTYFIILRFSYNVSKIYEWFIRFLWAFFSYCNIWMRQYCTDDSVKEAVRSHTCTQTFGFFKWKCRRADVVVALNYRRKLLFEIINLHMKRGVPL